MKNLIEDGIGGPFRAVKPIESNGYWNVEDSNGEGICTCYTSRAEQVAKMIAVALNVHEIKS